MANIGAAALLLLMASQVESGQETSSQSADVVDTTNGQSTAINTDDATNLKGARSGRILSRRETRLNTRITTKKLTTIGRMSGASKQQSESERQGSSGQKTERQGSSGQVDR